METATKRLYEGMFLVDSAQAAADWDGTLGVIENILKRADADVVSMRKWGERRLAYEIDHQTRGTYILCYFRANGQRIAGIEKDVQLSEKVMRVLVLGTEKRPAAMIEADISGVPAEAEESASEGETAREGAPKGAETPSAAEESAPPAEGQAPEKQEAPAVEPAAEGGAEPVAETPATEVPAQEPAAAPESPASDEQSTPTEAPAAEPEAAAEPEPEEPEKL